MSENNEKVIKRIARLLAVTFLYSGSPNLVDRIANALSKEAVAKALYDAQRIVQVGFGKNEIKSYTKQDEKGKKYNIIQITVDNNNYEVRGSLPMEQDIEKFLSIIEKDIYYARKAGALAMSIVIRNVSREKVAQQVR